MKKKIISVLAFSVLLGLTGCGSQGSTTPPVTEPDPDPTVDPELVKARKEALEYIDGIDLSIYRTAEKTELEAQIASAKTSINKEDATKESINSVVTGLKSFISTLKTDAEYTDEEEKAKEKALKEAKEAKIDSLVVKDPTKFRKEEYEDIEAKHDALVADINSKTSVEDVNAVNTNEFTTLIKDSKTAGQYFNEELLKYSNPSEWPLVNEHSATWKLNEGKIRADQVAYVLDDNTAYEDVAFSFSVTATGDIGIAGVLNAKPNATGDGIDGYLINIVSNSTQAFVQVYYLNNCYCSSGSPICDYIGGWVYDRGVTNGTEFRIAFEGSDALIYENNEYETSGTSSFHVAVDLTKGGVYELVKNTNLGLINWDAGKTYDIGIKDIITPENEYISGKERASKFITKYHDSIDFAAYDSDDSDTIESYFDDIPDKIKDNNVSYKDLLDELESIKGKVALIKTTLQKNLPVAKANKIKQLNFEPKAYASDQLSAAQSVYDAAVAGINACETVEAVNSYDLSTYFSAIDAVPGIADKVAGEIKNNPTTSNWSLVTDHSANWTYDGKKTISTPAADTIAWQLGSTEYTNFDIVFNLTTDATTTTPDAHRSYIVRGKKDNTGFSGYIINIVSKTETNEQYIQILWVKGAYCAGSDPSELNQIVYLNGLICNKKAMGLNVRVRFNGSNVSIFYEDEYTSDSEPAATFSVNDGAHEVYNSGKVGIVKWDGNNYKFKFNKFVVNE